MSPSPHPTSTVNFGDRLASAVRSRKTPVLVGLDPRLDQLPEGLRPSDTSPQSAARAYLRFCQEILDVVASRVAVVKPQAAFFEELGPAGMQALAEVIQHARQRGLLVIVDGKRNDIGSTAEAYARGYLGACSAWAADALTVSPYLGDDSLTPFVDVARETGSGIFVLVKTSNPGGKTFQDQNVGTGPLYASVGSLTESLAAASAGASGYGAVGAVVGATYPAQLAELRAAMPHTWFLVPGFGAQGGSAQDVAAGFDPSGLGAIVNNSRGIIFAHRAARYRDRFASRGAESNWWQEAVAAATTDMIEELRTHTPAGKLS